MNLQSRCARTNRLTRTVSCLTGVTVALLLPLATAAICLGAPVQPAMPMTDIPAGDFLMGSPKEYGYNAEENPQHTVYLDAFRMDAYEVTNEMFAAFLNAQAKQENFEAKRQSWVVIRNDLDLPAKKDWWPTEIEFTSGLYRPIKGYEKHPVVSVSWHAADSFCRWAGKRLPTEAEWEKAARGGLAAKDYPWGNAMPTEGVVFRRVWANNVLPVPTEAAGSYYPNGYGLYETAGNAAEWCADWYDPDYYRSAPRNNPAGPERGSEKVVRGGSWASNVANVRVGFRNFSLPGNRNSGVGFRCAADKK